MKMTPELLNAINPLKEPLTPDILRKLSGNSSLNDEEALRIIQSINQLSTILLELTRLKNNYSFKNQEGLFWEEDVEEDEPIVHINPPSKNKAA